MQRVDTMASTQQFPTVAPAYTQMMKNNEDFIITPIDVTHVLGSFPHDLTM
jgi:hypothetical protein